MAPNGKVRIGKVVSDHLKTEVAAAAQAEGMSESAYLAGLVGCSADYLAYHQRREQQICAFVILCEAWFHDLMVLKMSGCDRGKEYLNIENRLLELQKLEKLILEEEK